MWQVTFHHSYNYNKVEKIPDLRKLRICLTSENPSVVAMTSTMSITVASSAVLIQSVVSGKLHSFS